MADVDPIALPISLQPSNLRPIAYRVLTKKFGLNIQSDALKRLTEVIGQRFGKDWRSPRAINFLEKIGQSWKAQDLGVFLLNGDQLETVIDALIQAEKSELKRKTKPASLAELVTPAPQEEFEVFQSQPDEDMEEPAELVWKDYFHIVDAFRLPVYKYNHVRKQYEFVPQALTEQRNVKIPLSGVLANVKSYSEMFITRYKIASDRLLRNDNFQTSHGEKHTMNSITGSTINTLAQTVSSIKNMLGRHGQHFLLFGLFTKNSQGFWQLQDDTGAIELKLDQCVFGSDCYFTPGCMLLCDGIYSNVGKFYVSVMGHPPPERRELSLEAHNIDFFKSGRTTLPRIDTELQKRLELLEREHHEHRMIVLGGDIWLNDHKTLDGLRKVFMKLNAEVEEDHSYEIHPLCIILNGSFVGSPFTTSSFNSTTVSSASASSSATYKAALDSLAILLEGFPALCKNATFVFVPGTNDPWGSVSHKGANVMWPQTSIPKLFGTKLNRLLKNCVWVSNPAKMQYMSHDICIVRDNLGERFRRHDITYLGKPEGDDDDKDNDVKLEIDKLALSPLAGVPADVKEARKVVKTVLDQAHLSPFTQETKPVLWNMDHVLQLTPLPHVMFLTDSTTPTFDVTYEGCHVVNPGKFLQGSKCSYMEYVPSTKKVHLKQVYI